MDTGRRGTQVTGAAREKLAAVLKEKYESGATIRALAKLTGRSYGFVYDVLGESEVTLRHRGGNTKKKKPSKPPAQVGAG
ncbi:helix-turn-helix domain-containing protein [Kitasatospora purpeofusca]|uniref:helix-turn-helix domain-containing protein n=1 Tax=Kitasatospora purpeofusca TaxID=67352 RepID=UPI00369D06D5